MTEKKSKWEKPKLIVLVRGDRQEAVLQTCKVSSPDIGATGVGFACKWGGTVGGPDDPDCVACSSMSGA